MKTFKLLALVISFNCVFLNNLYANALEMYIPDWSIEPAYSQKEMLPTNECTTEELGWSVALNPALGLITDVRENPICIYHDDGYSFTRYYREYKINGRTLGESGYAFAVGNEKILRPVDELGNGADGRVLYSKFRKELLFTGITETYFNKYVYKYNNFASLLKLDVATQKYSIIGSPTRLESNGSPVRSYSIGFLK